MRPVQQFFEHCLKTLPQSRAFLSGKAVVSLQKRPDRTGEPIEIDRGGKKLLIVPKEKLAKLKNLIRRDVIVGDPEDLVHLDWSTEWRGDLP
jgi:hypothetical protein